MAPFAGNVQVQGARGGWAGFVAFAFVFCGLAGLLLFFTVQHTRPRLPAASPTPWVPPPPADGYAWYPQGSPVFADLDGDDVEDVVGLRWDAGHKEQALWIVGTSGKTLRTLWSAGPMKSQWAGAGTHLAQSGALVYVTSSEATIRAFDLRTGRELGRRALADTAYDLCSADEGDPRAWVAGRDGEDGVLFTGALEAEPRIMRRPSWCKPRWERNSTPLCPRVATKGPPSPCRTFDLQAATEVARFAPHLTLREGDATVALGETTAGVPLGAPALPFAVGFDPKTRAVRWKGALVAEEDTLHLVPGVASELQSGGLYAVYQTRSGPLKLFARDAMTGAPLFTATVPGSAEGSTRERLTVTKTRLYLPIDNRLAVFGATYGTAVGSVPGGAL